MQKLKLFLKLFIFISTLLVLFLIPSSASANNDNDFLVKFKTPENREEAAKILGVETGKLQKISQVNVFKIEKPSAWQKTKMYQAKLFSKKIEYIEPDYQYKLAKISNDTYYSSQWALPMISAPTAWDATTGSSALKIAIVDTGINGLHEDLNGKITAGYAYLDAGMTEYAIGANTNSDEQGHGTAVAGVTAAITDNSKGIAGLNWQAQLMPVRVFDEYLPGEWWAYSSDVASGIIFAADNGAKVINLSLGGQYPSTTIEDAINYAYNTHGAVVVAASGNENTAVSYPAKYEHVIAVGSTNSSDARCTPANCGYGSNYGPELDVVAPGSSVLTTENSLLYNEYYSVSGTSIAAPYVSALAALLWAHRPSFTNSEVKATIEQNADKPAGMGGSNFTNYYGYGRINANETLNPSPSQDPSKYHNQWISQNAYPTLTAGQGYNFIVNIRNTGEATWYKGLVNLGTNNAQDRVPAFDRSDVQNLYGHPSHWISPNRIEMLEASVAPGETATFSFWLSATTNTPPGTYREFFRLVAEGVTWMEDQGIYWDITVKSLPDTYHSQWISQNAYPTITRGNGYNFVVNIKNTGEATWYKNSVNLGTNNPQDRVPIFDRADINNLYGHPSHWLSSNRVFMNEDSVGPGETVTFSFWMSARDNVSPGIYRDFFRMVAEGITWMEDQGIYWDITVN